MPKQCDGKVSIMKYTFEYGRGEMSFDLDESRVNEVLHQNQIDWKLLSPEEELKRALRSPIGTERLEKIIKPGEKIAIITSDISRPLPGHVVLPVLVDELYAAGAKKEDITIVFALGSHRGHTEEEKEYLVGSRLYREIRCIDTDPDDCLRAGITSNGTVVDIFSEVMKADRRICVGNIEYHYFVGYSGGIKAIMPGVSTKEAIRLNHSHMVEAGAKAGNINSPVRKDIEEVSGLCSVDFILNVVLDEDKNVIRAVAGHHETAHREGCDYLDRVYKKPIKERADIVIVTPGGFPKDQNMYQAQKALDNAKEAVRDGGIIIWAAACTEGLGSELFEKWMRDYEPDFMIEEIKRDFKLGAHKAAAIAMVLKRADIFLISELEDDFVKNMGFIPFASIDQAIAEANLRLGSDSSVIIMPHGGSTLPIEEFSR